MLYVLSCPMCLVPYVPSCLVPYVSRALRALVPYVPRVLRASCPTCFSCPTCSHAPHALRALVPRTIVHSCPTYIVPYVLSCLTCSRAIHALVPRALRVLRVCIFLGCSWLRLYGTCATEFWIVLSHYRVYSILQEIFNTESDLMCFNSERS